jgi:hypothetical protein
MIFPPANVGDVSIAAQDIRCLDLNASIARGPIGTIQVTRSRRSTVRRELTRGGS